MSQITPRIGIRFMLEQAAKPTALSFLVDFERMRAMLLRIALAGSHGWGTIEGHARITRRIALRKKAWGLVHHDRYLNSIKYDRTRSLAVPAPEVAVPAPEVANRQCVGCGIHGFVQAEPHAQNVLVYRLILARLFSAWYNRGTVNGDRAIGG